MTRTVATALAIAVLTAALSSCQSNEPLRLVQIQLGRSLNADNTIAVPAFSFKPHDTVFLSVMTAGRGSGTVSVRWTYAGHLIDEPKKQIHYAYKDSAATDFRLESAMGFPPGEYSAEVFIDGRPSGTKKFRVE
jgi:hypothetical protein